MTERSEDNTSGRQATRREMLALRAGMSTATHAEASARIVGHLIKTLAAPKIAAFCWPIKHEPDVRAVLAEWAKQGTLAALPVVTAPATPLAFRLWTAETAMMADRYGIPTPASGDFVQPDLILLPLNGFDAQGYRLGYGGGFFDRTLAALSPRPLAVGVGFEINRLSSIRPEIHDQQLDWIVTENGAFRPKLRPIRA
jgi:5,10-methenyltetrahydrofolate synthetase